MGLELHVVFGDDDVQSVGCIGDFPQVKNLHVVLGNLGCQQEGRHVDDVDVWVFQSENSRNLGVFPLLIFLETHASQLCDAERVYMDFDSALLLDCRPANFELLLHFFPHLERLLMQLFELGPGRLLELVKPVLPLDEGRHLHEMFELLE